MLLISKEQVTALRERLGRPGELASCIEEVKAMREIKSVLLWRADAACSCIGNSVSNSLYGEMEIIEAVLRALEQKDLSVAASLLDEYALLIK